MGAIYDIWEALFGLIVVIDHIASRIEGLTKNKGENTGFKGCGQSRTITAKNKVQRSQIRLCPHGARLWLLKLCGTPNNPLFCR